MHVGDGSPRHVTSPGHARRRTRRLSSVWAIVSGAVLVFGSFEGMLAAAGGMPTAPTAARGGGAGADQAGAYRATGSTGDHFITHGADRIVLRHAGADAVVSVPGPSVRNAVARFRFRLSSVPTGDGVSVAAVFRSRPGNQYRVTVRVASDGTVWLSAVRVRLGITQPIGHEVRVPDLQITPGASLSVRAAVTGNRAVTLRARVWPTSSAEPHGWQLVRRGHGASLKAPGRVGLRVSLSRNATRVPVKVAVDGMQVSRISNPIDRAGSGATRGATGKRAKGPVISHLRVTHRSETSATISWTLDRPSTGRVQYGRNRHYGARSGPERSFRHTKHLTLTGLEPGTRYHFRVRSTDRAGRETISADHTFRTSGVSATSTPYPRIGPAPAPTVTSPPAPTPTPDSRPNPRRPRTPGRIPRRPRIRPTPLSSRATPREPRT